MWIVLLIAGLIGLIAVWELWICEGAHLGRRAVVFLYDLTARRYERIKRFDPAWERQYLGEPFARTLAWRIDRWSSPGYTAPAGREREWRPTRCPSTVRALAPRSLEGRST